MIIRYLKSSDLPHLKHIYKGMGIPLPFPEMTDFLPNIPVVVDQENKVVAAVGCIPTVEIFFFLDRKWETPGMRFEALKALHEFTRLDMKARGFKQAHSFLPPEFAKIFGRRLVKCFKWFHVTWTCFSRRIDHG